jgi:hypothetical protein
MKHHWYFNENFFTKEEVKKINKTILINRDKNWNDIHQGSLKKCEVIVSQYKECKLILKKAVEYLHFINDRQGDHS